MPALWPLFPLLSLQMLQSLAAGLHVDHSQIAPFTKPSVPPLPADLLAGAAAAAAAARDPGADTVRPRLGASQVRAPGRQSKRGVGALHCWTCRASHCSQLMPLLHLLLRVCRRCSPAAVRAAAAPLALLLSTACMVRARARLWSLQVRSGGERDSEGGWQAWWLCPTGSPRLPATASLTQSLCHVSLLRVAAEKLPAAAAVCSAHVLAAPTPHHNALFGKVG